MKLSIDTGKNAELLQKQKAKSYKRTFADLFVKSTLLPLVAWIVCSGSRLNAVNSQNFNNVYFFHIKINSPYYHNLRDVHTINLSLVARRQ